MTNSSKPTLNSLLKIDMDDNEIWLTNSSTLRRIIGISGMALPVLLYLFLYIDSGLGSPLESISHYYYTRVCSIFIVILSLLAIFLIVYKGKEPIDFYVSLVAGIFALCVVFFPTDNLAEKCEDLVKTHSVTILNNSNFRTNFHYASAGIFLSCLAYMSLFLFTKSKKAPEHRGIKKIIRNRIYRVSGGLMIVAILVIFSGLLEIIPPVFYKENEITFWMETLAVESFGFAWLVKGETIFKD